MWRILFILACFLCCPSVDAADSQPTLVVASSGKHLWIAVPTKDGCRIVHHALEMDGAFLREVTTLPAIPIALAAHENQLAIIMPPSGIPLASSVYALTTNRNPATGSFYYTPMGRLDVLPSIQSSSQIANAVVGANGIFALIPGETPELIRAAPLSWSRVELPQGAGADAELVPWAVVGDPTAFAMLRVDGADLVTWALASTRIADRAGASSGATSAANNLDGGHDWAQQRWVGSGVGFDMVIGGSDRPAILTRDSSGALSIAYPTTSGLRSLSAIVVPAGAWSIAGLGEDFKMIWVDDVGNVHLSSVDSLSGTASASEVLIQQPTTTGDWIHLPFIGALTIGMLLAGFIVRPPLQPPHPMQGGWDPLPMFRRIAALAIDLLPGALFALWITGARIEELMSMPSWTPDLGHAAPASIMLGFTGVWCGIFEVVLRATPGKFVFGGRIVRAPDGGTDMRAGFGRTLVRALLKTVVLFAPALGFLAFVHPLQQGLPETLSKTVIARRR